MHHIIASSTQVVTQNPNQPGLLLRLRVTPFDRVRRLFNLPSSDLSPEQRDFLADILKKFEEACQGNLQESLPPLVAAFWYNISKDQEQEILEILNELFEGNQDSKGYLNEYEKKMKIASQRDKFAKIKRDIFNRIGQAASDVEKNEASKRSQALDALSQMQAITEKTLNRTKEVEAEANKTEKATLKSLTSLKLIIEKRT